MKVFDLKIYYNSNQESNLGPGELKKINNAISQDSTLTTSFLISVLTDRRDKNNNGCYLDDLLGMRIGSKLWTLERSKLTNETMLLIEQYILESTQWLIDDKFLKEISCTVSRLGDQIIVENKLIDFSSETSIVKFGIDLNR